MPTKPIKTQHLTDRQLAAIELIVTGTSLGDVATKLGLNRCTLSTWKNQPAFRETLTRLRAEALSATGEELRSLGEQCVAVIRAELRDGPNKAAVALKVLQMIGVEKLLQESLPTFADGAKDSDQDRVAGHGRAAMIEREIERLLVGRRSRFTSYALTNRYAASWSDPTAGRATPRKTTTALSDRQGH